MDLTSFPFPKIGGSKDYTLTEDLNLGHRILPRGSVVLLKHTRDAGYVILQKGQKDSSGVEISRRIYRY